MEGLIKEKTFSEQTGISRTLLIEERKKSLSFPDDWRKDGREIVYTQSGVQHMRNLFKLSNAPAEEPKQVESEHEEAAVVRHNYPNYKVILCRRSNGEDVSVRVSHNRNFRIRTANGEPMMVPIKKDGNVWTFAGKRMPRFPGKW